MYKFILLLFLQFVILYWLLFYKKSNLNNKRIAIYSTFFFYISIIIFVIIERVTLKYELNSFDLNNDGFFRNEEITLNQKQALKDVISDTKLIFAPFIGLIYSLIYFLIIYFILKIFRKENIKTEAFESQQASKY